MPGIRMKFKARRHHWNAVSREMVRQVNSARSCYWCNRRIASGPLFRNEPNEKTKEHLVPRSLGGSGAKVNVVPACKSCNNRRGADANWVPYAVHRGRRGFMPPKQADAMQAGGAVVVA